MARVRCAHGSPRGLGLGRDAVRDDSFGARFDADDDLGRLDRRITPQWLPGVDPVKFMTHQWRLDVRDANLAETELDGPLQELSVRVDADRRTAVAGPVEHQLGDL